MPLLTISLALIPAGRVTAQIFTTLHSFTPNSDGVDSVAGLILSGNTLYGTAAYGGSSGLGTVFALNIDGTGFTNLHNFGSDGNRPFSRLVLSGDTLYGTTSDGGNAGPGHAGSGTVFAVNTDGTGFTNLYSFTGLIGGTGINSDGASPNDGLVLSGDTLYGTADGGGSNGVGAVFKVKTNGMNFTTIHIFSALINFGNSDGAYPLAALTLSGSTLFGTTGGGGTSGRGTIFAVNTDGAGFTNLHSFTQLISGTTNNDGADPNAGVILSSDKLYGMTAIGGGSGVGTVFKLNTDGTGFSTLHSFTGGDDGGYPGNGLTLWGSALYGQTSHGGSSGAGTVFKVNTDGTGFMILHAFTPVVSGTNYDGATPLGNFVFSENTLYGAASAGGGAGGGTVFSIFIQPQLTIIPSGPYLILTWPTNYTGFTLQSNTNLVSTPVWTTVSPGPVVIGGQNAVVNTISGTQQFYRLSR